MPRAKFVLIPISDATRGHGTHTLAAIWKDYLVGLLAELGPKLSKVDGKDFMAEVERGA